MIDAAIVGLGRWGRTLVDSVQGKSEKIRFTRAVTRDPAQHADYLRERHLDPVTDYAAVLADRTIDAVVLATPHTRHVDEVVAAAGAGKAVFCEKPLALTRDGTARAVEACRAAGVVLGIGTDKRYFPAIAELIRRVDSGEMGPLLHVEGNFSNEVAAGFAAWRDDRTETPAGGMTGTGIHVLDALIRIAGPVRRIHAQLLAQKPSPDPHDTVAVLLEFAAGIGGTLAAVRSTPNFLRIHAFCRNGSAEALSRTEMVIRKSGADLERLKLSGPDSVLTNLESFADAVAGNAPYPIPPEQITNVTNSFIAISEAVQGGFGTREV
ncbi:MAG TPA: Gfo/Idh/MocA family oxidoreductase [Stellaceae bacterium]|jgi:predicted dehydrogenase|nr:Gfo/Idh/MocA family oxidoreductase [Stellaceae bacterium]